MVGSPLLLCGVVDLYRGVHWLRAGVFLVALDRFKWRAIVFHAAGFTPVGLAWQTSRRVHLGGTGYFFGGAQR
jgi:hypothetical protein